MQKASDAYKQMMEQQYRNQFYMWVTIGVINQVAHPISVTPADHVANE